MRAPIWSLNDHAFMAQALDLARQQLGKTGDNLAAVGCVIVCDGHIVGKGATGNNGRPHAEAIALAQAGTLAKGSTVYVTLEPCAHHSEKGPTCSDSLIEAGISRLVACLEDPDPRTAGAGFARLIEAGVLVDVGLMEDEGREQVFALVALHQR